MASADLEHIRALLIAQTAEPEPQSKGPFGRWLSAKRQRRPAPPLALEPARVPACVPGRVPGRVKITVIRADHTDPDQELLLERICGPRPIPPPVDLQPSPQAPTEAPLALETASPLPPPSPRAAFGRRADLGAEMELMLDQPASAPRRLQVLDTSGQPIGEMILPPDDPPLRAVFAVREDAVPFFPEDLEEHPAPLRGPEPMRPWIKALRAASAPKLEKLDEPDEPAPTPEPAKPPEPPPAGARHAATPTPPMPPHPPQNPGLNRDLLEALALTLTREHETLADRLAAVEFEALFE